jgi:hypothetical protein
LHYMATGKKGTPEYSMFLNKLLCGIDPTEPIPATMRLTIKHQQLVEEYMRALMEKWDMSVFGAMTLGGFRHSFILREASVLPNGKNWILKNVPEKAWDFVLDRFPDRLSVIEKPWFNYVINVEWR